MIGEYTAHGVCLGSRCGCVNPDVPITRGDQRLTMTTKDETAMMDVRWKEERGECGVDSLMCWREVQ